MSRTDRPFTRSLTICSPSLSSVIAPSHLSIRERRRAAEYVAGLGFELTDARRAERAALVRTERAEAEAGTLRAQLTAALRDKSTGGRRGAT